jgi:hypothetical protein
MRDFLVLTLLSKWFKEQATSHRLQPQHCLKSILSFFKTLSSTKRVVTGTH